MIRTYIRIKYEYSPIYDSEYYKEAARIINRCLMGKLDNDKENDSYGEIVVSSKNFLSLDEIKKIIKYLWESVINNAKGSYYGFDYKNLRPESFKISIQESEDNHICKRSVDIVNISENIIECFSMVDMNRIFDVYDSRKIFL